MSKVFELLMKGKNILKEKGIDSYNIDANLLLVKAIKKDKMFIIMNRDFEVSKEDEDEFFSFIEKRSKFMPVKYILEECEFYGSDFYVKPGVLIPRPDTETLVQTVLDEIKKNDYKNICDLCCGSGAIGISIALNTDNTIVDCIDIEETPLEVTEYNIKLHKLHQRVKVFKSDLMEECIKNKNQYDVIASNPPYIRDDVIGTLMNDVKDYEPIVALSGGQDGLIFYKKIIEQSKLALKAGGLLAFEIGYDQGEEVKSLMKCSGFKNIEILKDLALKDRVVKGFK